MDWARFGLDVVIDMIAVIEFVSNAGYLQLLTRIQFDCMKYSIQYSTLV